MVDHSVARIHWIGDAPSPEIVAKVRENISKISEQELFRKLLKEV